MIGFMNKKILKISQSIVEYVVFVGVIVAALAVMQLYAKRGIQATLKAGADTVGGQTDSVVTTNGTQQAWIASMDTNMTGNNAIRGVEQTTVNKGKYSKTEVSSSSTDFGGASISDVVEDKSAQAVRTPGAVMPYPDSCSLPYSQVNYDYSSSLNCFRLTQVRYGYLWTESVDCNSTPVWTDASGNPSPTNERRQRFACLPKSDNTLLEDTHPLSYYDHDQGSQAGSGYAELNLYIAGNPIYMASLNYGYAYTYYIDNLVDECPCPPSFPANYASFADRITSI
jgi:hypothetical protein